MKCGTLVGGLTEHAQPPVETLVETLVRSPAQLVVIEGRQRRPELAVPAVPVGGDEDSRAQLGALEVLADAGALPVDEGEELPDRIELTVVVVLVAEARGWVVALARRLGVQPGET